MEVFGLGVNRLIRVEFGPYKLQGHTKDGGEQPERLREAPRRNQGKPRESTLHLFPLPHATTRHLRDRRHDLNDRPTQPTPYRLQMKNTSLAPT